MTPCCSQILECPQVIEPKEQAQVKTRLLGGHKTERKEVRFLVRTDDERRPIVVLSVRANLQAEFEALHLTRQPPILHVGETGKLRLKLIARKRAEAGRALPARVEGLPPVLARFVSEPVETAQSAGIFEQSREVELTMPAADRSGGFRAVCRFFWDDGLEHQLASGYQVRDWVKITPAALTLKPAEGPQKRLVTLTCEDQPIKVLNIRGDLTAKLGEQATEPAHLIKLEVDLDPSRAASARAFDACIETSHPRQPRVWLSILVLPKG